MHDMKKKQQFIELRASGTSYTTIAKELNVSRQTLVNWSKELNFEVANMKAIDLEHFQHTHQLAKEFRLKLFGEVLEKVRAELTSRDFKDLPTEKLIDMLLKLNTAVNLEHSDIVFKTIETRTPMDHALEVFVDKDVVEWAG